MEHGLRDGPPPREARREWSRGWVKKPGSCDQAGVADTHFSCAAMVFQAANPKRARPYDSGNVISGKSDVYWGLARRSIPCPGRIQVADFLCEFDRPTNPATR
jgi:hypothetical protein